MLTRRLRTADICLMSANVDRRLLAQWEDARERSAEEERFLRTIRRERRLSEAPPSRDLFLDQLAALRQRIARQRVRLGEVESFDEPA
jgi:hypothetical protein